MAHPTPHPAPRPRPAGRFDAAAGLPFADFLPAEAVERFVFLFRVPPPEIGLVRPAPLWHNPPCTPGRSRPDATTH